MHKNELRKEKISCLKKKKKFKKRIIQLKKTQLDHQIQNYEIRGVPLMIMKK